jgi:hypothetical protein
VKHEFRDTLKIQVDHEHEIDPEVVETLIDRAVEGAITIIAVATVAHILRKRLS